MQQKDMEIRVFLVPEGEEASLFAYEKLVELLETYEDVFLTVYRGPNRYDRTWSLVLIGEKTSLSRYHKEIQHPLSEVHAQPITVSPESLAPLVERFLVRQAEMLQTKQTFVEKHHPRRQKDAVKKKAVRQSRRGGKRHK